MPSSAIIALLLQARQCDTRQRLLSNDQLERLRALRGEMRETTPTWAVTILRALQDVNERLERVERRFER
jgi:hypothetical protein